MAAYNFKKSHIKLHNATGWTTVYQKKRQLTGGAAYTAPSRAKYRKSKPLPQSQELTSEAA